MAVDGLYRIDELEGRCHQGRLSGCRTIRARLEASIVTKLRR
jgi:hypothetical protein